MTDQEFYLLIGVAAVVCIALFVVSNRAKRRHEEERLKRRRELDRIKAEARAREQAAREQG